MKKQILFTATAIATFLFAAQIETAAQGGAAKVGDRVENVSMYGEKGTIEEVGSGEYKDCYRVLPDAYKGKGKKGDWVCTYGQSNILFILDAGGKRVRDVNAPGAAEKQETAPAETARTKPAGNTPPAQPAAGMPKLCGEPLALEPKTKGRAPSAALFKEVIKALWDRDKDSKGWGRRVTAIDNLIVGAAYAWRPNVDFQSLGTKPKTVYPVKVKYTTCEEQMLEWRVTETTTEEIYSCYVEDEFRQWTCAIRKAAEFKKTYFDKPEKKKITGE